MTTRERLESVAWATAVVCACAVAFGYWYVALVAAVSAAVATMWLGCIDYCAERTRPPEPEGVRIVHPDGSETPCELAYIGVQHGWHEWAITTLMGVGDELRVAKIHACAVITADVTDDVTGARWDGRQYRMEGKA